ncbi:MAG: hypothetical protein H6737_02615 [Alphaproteobacteria bacterium]|nr:hypothetical protein [Alphaproteobacteria bacterium]
MIALGVALAVPVGDGQEAAFAESGDLEIVPVSMFVPRNRVVAMRMQAEGGVGVLDWDVSVDAEVGHAVFEDDLLYFVPVLGQEGPQWIEVTATDELGVTATETVDVMVGRQGGCSHLGGASGWMALAGLALVGLRGRSRAA